MSNPEQFIREVFQGNQHISASISQSFREERVNSCHEFLNLNPNLQAFFWVRSNLDYSLENVSNLKYVMGYDILNSKQSVRMIHPKHIGMYYKICLALNAFCASGKLGQSILNFTFVMNIPMRDVNNRYWYVRQRSSACEINKKSQVLSFLSWHDVIRPYYGEPITFQGYSNQGVRLYDIEENLKQQADYYPSLPFTERQRDILKIYIKMEEPNADTIAEITGIKKETVYTHNRDMLQRARNKYGRSFRDVFHLADFFKRHEVFETTPKD